MFLEAEGPTALRPEMIQVLCFSTQEQLVDSPVGAERCVVALAAVWNGKQGFVAVLVRSLDQPAVRRFTYTEPLRTLEDLEGAVQEGHGLASSMGFTLDSGDFAGLEGPEQKLRFTRWNQLRKPRQRSAAATADSERPVRAEPPTQSTPEEPGGGAVLGRIALVQKGGDGKPDWLTQLLAFF